MAAHFHEMGSESKREESTQFPATTPKDSQRSPESRLCDTTKTPYRKLGVFLLLLAGLALFAVKFQISFQSWHNDVD